MEGPRPFWGLSRPHCREDRRLPRLILSRPPELMTEAEREAFVFDLRMALRQVAPETWRDLDTRRLPVDDLVEKIVARKLLEHMLLCRWAIERLPTPGCRRRGDRGGGGSIGMIARDGPPRSTDGLGRRL